MPRLFVIRQALDVADVVDKPMHGLAKAGLVKPVAELLRQDARRRRAVQHDPLHMQRSVLFIPIVLGCILHNFLHYISSFFAYPMQAACSRRWITLPAALSARLWR